LARTTADGLEAINSMPIQSGIHVNVAPADLSVAARVPGSHDV
jgi:hypothetical protein